MVFFFHMEVASDSFSFLIYSSWLLVFILGVFYLFLSGFNSYCWKGIHFSQNLDSCLALTSQLQKPSNENVGSSLTRMLVHYLIREYTVNIPSYVLSGCDQDSNNVQRFSLDSNNNGFSLSSFFLLRMYFGNWISIIVQKKAFSLRQLTTSLTIPRFLCYHQDSL